MVSWNWAWRRVGLCWWWLGDVWCGRFWNGGWGTRWTHAACFLGKAWRWFRRNGDTLHLLTREEQTANEALGTCEESLGWT